MKRIFSTLLATGLIALSNCQLTLDLTESASDVNGFLQQVQQTANPYSFNISLTSYTATFIMGSANTRV